MILLLFFLLSGYLEAAQPVYWGHLLELTNKHEFYPSDEVITKPRESWQNLFTFSYIDQDLKRLKDCVFYFVPGETAPGALKIKTIAAHERCDDYLLLPGDSEVKNIKTLLFNVQPELVTFEIGHMDFRSERWEARFQHSFLRPAPAMGLSSAAYKSSKIVLLAPRRLLKEAESPIALRPGFECHKINDDCEEVTPPTCDQCPEGWYEIPNGCFQGPKYCGRQNCGTKGKPACRRGMVWQRKEMERFDCRTDSSFAFCAPGLSVQCEGMKAFCR